MSNEREQPQMLNVQTAAQRIDAYFDGLLFEGMPMEQARWVERQRDAAHAALTRQALAAELDGWQQPGRM
jgi:hypothetical protein